MTMPSEWKSGGCLCGAVRYEVDMQGSRSGNCHCRDCQKNGGGPFMTFTTPLAGNFRWLSEPDGIAKASRVARRRFCARCGTPMTWEHETRPADFAFSTGTLDDPSAVTLIYEIFTRTRWACFPPLPGVDQFEASN